MTISQDCCIDNIKYFMESAYPTALVTQKQTLAIIKQELLQVNRVSQLFFL